MTRRVVVPHGRWTLMVTDGPHGTDLGLLPSWPRASCTAPQSGRCVADGTAIYPARILEVYGPQGTQPLLCVRSIAAADDGGRWTFETTGEPRSRPHA